MINERDMTALELNAELYRAIGDIAEDETLLTKVLKYVKDLASIKNSKAEAPAPDTDKRLDATLKKFHSDWGGNGDAMEIAEELRRNVVNNRTVETW